jgi:hypothetical protein
MFLGSGEGTALVSTLVSGVLTVDGGYKKMGLDCQPTYPRLSNVRLWQILLIKSFLEVDPKISASWMSFIKFEPGGLPFTHYLAV